MTDEDLRKMLEQHREDFGGFQVDWREHRLEAREAMKKLDMVHTSLVSIAPNVAHLGQLPLIAHSLASIDKAHATQMSALINQAGAAGKSSSKIVGSMLLVCLAVVVLFGVATLIIFIRDSNKDLRLDRSGISISAPVDNKKTKELVE